MDNILAELLEKIKELEAKVDSLLGGKNETRKVSTADIKNYIISLKKEAISKGNEFVVVLANDVHADLKLTNSMPMVCNAMYQLMGDRDEIIFRSQSGYSSKLQIKYFLNNESSNKLILKEEGVEMTTQKTGINKADYEYEWRRKKGNVIAEIEKVFNDLQSAVELDHLTFQKQYLGVNINGVNRAILKFRPKNDFFFLEISDRKSRTGEKLKLLQEQGLPVVYLDDPKDEPKRYYYRITLKNYDNYLVYRDIIDQLVKYYYHISL